MSYVTLNFESVVGAVIIVNLGRHAQTLTAPAKN